MTFRPPVFLVLAGMLLLSLLSTPVHAEPRWQIIPSVSLLASYDDNLFLQKDREEDVLTQAGVRIAPRYRGTGLSLVGSYGFQMETFARHPEENRITQDGSVQADLSRGFQRFVRSGNITAYESFTFTSDLQGYYFDEERQQVGSLSNYGIHTQRTDSFRNAFTLALSAPMTSRWTLQGRYGNLLTEYKDSLLVDNMTHSLMIGTSYPLGQTTPYTELESSLIRWEKKDSYSHRLSLGVRHTLSREWKMDLHTGILRFDSEGEKIRDTLNAGLTFSRQGHYHMISLGYSNTINPAAGIGTHPPIAQLFHANWTTLINPEVSSSLGGSYAINTSLLETDLETRSYTVTAGMGYRVNKWLQANLSASHFNQDSNTPLADSLQREMVSLTLTGTWE